jgi:putative ABC transport system ATP-binding protein
MRSFIRLLEKTGVAEPLLRLGYTLAWQTVQLLEECRNDEFFFRYTPMEPEEFKEYSRMIEDRHTGVPKSNQDRNLLYLLAFRFIPGFHKVAEMDHALEDKIVQARKLFLKNVVHLKMVSCAHDGDYGIYFKCEKKHISNPFMPFCPNQYLYQRTLLENLLFGVMKTRKPMGEELSNLLYSLLAKNVLDDVINVGLDFHVGSQGDRLSGGQKQKLAIARAFLRDTPIIFLDEATASLDNISQRRIQDVLDSKQKEGKTIVAVIHRLENSVLYDRILLLKNGSLKEEGTFSELLDQKGLFYELVKGTQQLE